MVISNESDNEKDMLITYVDKLSWLFFSGKMSRNASYDKLGRGFALLQAERIGQLLRALAVARGDPACNAAPRPLAWLRSLLIYGKYVSQVYAFTMIATMIPSILMTIITTANRLKQFDDVVAMGLPAFLVVLYGFLGLTISPARLYDEAHKSKTALYLNSSIWLPYRPEVYHIALALSTHLEQPNMGVTIWGFAILTKPLILATFSVMAMLLSLILELSPGDLSHHVLNLSLPS
ncbi:unnamed protein product [Heligmosomoides polygyrus]|uniref:Uncharacterized protein n=1 Tax=Heligmosomoides polygyrus TaxID=6339 RepID=A0A3P8BWT7_HELPZ|nr:unnamed protein product [Heligmosomoides polygyrus]